MAVNSARRNSTTRATRPRKTATRKTLTRQSPRRPRATSITHSAPCLQCVLAMKNNPHQVCIQSRGHTACQPCMRLRQPCTPFMTLTEVILNSTGNEKQALIRRLRIMMRTRTRAANLAAAEAATNEDRSDATSP
ncbi:uncharacterized protein N7459_005959 [Penicillium hispanicum]|uniref:uncharacterized protein n=1 Tax=Penicillium hispanicum TaxID=1080232 RepID=UPI00253FE5A5|nr:uncharacterized protein N7459_005959 [Penicillium hispanicum]KAJ5579974.1 hypothetical protein N7459_005959 [Penicillium hispanicum]